MEDDESDKLPPDISTNKNAVIKLSKELQEMKAMLESLQNENSQLRNFIKINCPQAPASALSPELPRKQVKRFHALPAGNNSINLTNSPLSIFNNTSSNNNKSEDKNSTSAGSVKFMPVPDSKGSRKNKIIQALDTNINTVLKSIKEANCKQFHIKQTNVKAPIKISISQPEEIPIVRTALQKSKISFHEFKWDSEKNKCFLIRGLVGVNDDAIADIFQELISYGVPPEAKLTIHTTGYMRANPNITHNSLLKLVVPPSFDTQVLKSIKYIDHVAVKFEKYKSNAVVQCKNCQRFGHSATGCQHLHRCVKCGDNHLREGCPRTFSKAVKLHCCNCGGEHTANNISACTFYLNKYAKKSLPTSNPGVTSVPVTSIPNTHKNSKMTYAAAAGNASNISTKGQEPNSNKQPTPSNFVVLERKIDIIFELVSKHEELFLKLYGHG